MLGTLAALAVSTMNSNAAVFGLQESGYGSPGGGYPTPTPEQLQAFYGAAVGGSTGSSGAGVTSSGNELRGGGGSSTTEPGSPITSPYGLHSESRNPPPETKYEPSHSPTHTQSGIISSDNGLQYANLDGSLADTKGYPSSGAYTGSHPHQASYQGHHASLLQASYAHHYGEASSEICYQNIDNYSPSRLSDRTLCLSGRKKNTFWSR